MYLLEIRKNENKLTKKSTSRKRAVKEAKVEELNEQGIVTSNLNNNIGQ